MTHAARSSLLAVAVVLVVAAHALSQQPLPAPQLSPGSGVYATKVTVKVTCSAPTYTVRYTTDGANPRRFSPSIPSGGTVTLNRIGVLKAACQADPFDVVGLLARGDYIITGAVAIGPEHIMLLKADGTVWTFCGFREF